MEVAAEQADRAREAEQRAGVGSAEYPHYYLILPEARTHNTISNSLSNELVRTILYVYLNYMDAVQCASGDEVNTYETHI